MNVRLLICLSLIVCIFIGAIGCASAVSDTAQTNERGLRGTYIAHTYAGESILVFKGDEITIENALGKAIYRYEIKPDEGKIYLYDYVTGKIKTHDFQYVPEIDCVVFDSFRHYKE